SREGPVGKGRPVHARDRAVEYRRYCRVRGPVRARVLPLRAVAGGARHAERRKAAEDPRDRAVSPLWTGPLAGRPPGIWSARCAESCCAPATTAMTRRGG